MGATFAQRFAAARSKWGPLVWGLDPSRSVLESWGLGDSPDGLDRFADVVLQAAVGTVGLVKPQSAFYERHGWRGIRTLTRLVADVRQAGLLVILDGKRGDVGTTNQAYADAYLGDGAPLASDALTVHPYLGLGAMGSLFSQAQDAGACLFVVVRSSNPEGRGLQVARTASGRSVEADLLAQLGELNASLAPQGIGPAGAVIGATSPAPASPMDPASHGQGSDDLDLVSARGLFLAPGVGAQGATATDVARAFASCPDRVLPSASRSLLAAGPDVGALRDSAASQAAELAAALGS